MADINSAINDRIKSDLQMNSTPEEAIGRLKLPQNYNPGQGVMNDAIKKKAYDRFYDPETIKEMQLYKTQGNQMNSANQLAGVAQAGANLTRQQMDLARQRVDDMKKQRAAVIGSVLGLAGMVVGGAIGGAPGAMAGGAVGQTVGSGIKNG